jgi:hypothetical protein
MAEPRSQPDLSRQEAVAAYKQLLREVLERRPSGTRQRLANAMGRNRSFVTQIANPAYPLALPARHVATILAVCHFSPAERDAFLAAYRRAHPERPVAVSARTMTRTAQLVLPDLGSPARNRAFDDLLAEFLTGLAGLMEAPREPGGWPATPPSKDETP